MTAGRGIVRTRPVEDPELRVFLFHHAGGSHTAFRGWSRRFPAQWDVCLVDAPGRGPVAWMPALLELDELVDYLLDEMSPWTDRPFALFGHSMGALVGFALTLRAQTAGRPLPFWLGLSAHPGPRTAEAPATSHLHRLGPERLRTAVAHMGGVPADVIADNRVWSQVEPLMRSDLVLSETWRPMPGPLVSPVPVSAFCGLDDPIAGPAVMTGWSEHTEWFLGVRAFPGGHFYFRSSSAAVVGRIVDDARRALGTSAQSE